MKKKINWQKVIGYFVLITLISTAIFLIFVIKDESVLWNLKLAIEYKKIKREEKLKLINKYLKQFELSDF